MAHDSAAVYNRASSRSASDRGARESDRGPGAPAARLGGAVDGAGPRGEAGPVERAEGAKQSEVAEEPSSIQDALAWLERRFRSEAAADLRIVYQLELDGDAGGVLGLRVDAGRLELAPAAISHPDVILRMPASDFYGVLSGRENPDLLFMADRLRVDGDLSLALKLRSLFAARA